MVNGLPKRSALALPSARGRSSPRNPTCSQSTMIPVDIRQHDALFAGRTSSSEWARIAAFRDLPDFLAGVRRHEGSMAPLLTGNPFLNKVATETWRFQILVFALYLHATADPANPRTGLTAANLQRVCSDLKLASPGRVLAFINILKLARYLTSIRSAADNRVVHLIPTAKFMAVVEAWNTNIFAAIDAARPDASLIALAEQYPGLGREMRISGAEGLMAGWDPLGPFPEVQHFADCDGGWLFMEHVIANWIGADGTVTIVPVSVKMRAIAKGFGGSRSNLLRLLERGHELGLLDQPPCGGANIVFSSRMVCSYFGFIASFLDNFHRHSLIGLDRLRAADRPLPRLP